MAARKQPSNRRKPDPDPDHPSRRRVPPSGEVRRQEELEKHRKNMRDGIPLPPRPTVHMFPPYGFDPERDVKQPGPGEKNDSTKWRYPRDKGLAGLLNMFRAG